jgi:hypothetical protein
MTRSEKEALCVTVIQREEVLVVRRGAVACLEIVRVRGAEVLAAHRAARSTVHHDVN